MKQFLMRFLGVDALPLDAQKLVQKYFIVLTTSSAFFLLSNTFYVLYVLSLVNFTQLGMLLAVSFATQALTDYPSGTLGDRIGHKWILFPIFCMDLV